ncbi:MAG: hypothetical protein ABIO91_09185 [Pyrinomonadaceae bacterium]
MIRELALNVFSIGLASAGLMGLLSPTDVRSQIRKGPTPVTSTRAEFSECRKNPDPKYDRESTLRKFEEILKSSVPAYAQFSHDGFFVFDLNNPGNRLIPKPFVKSSICIDFIEGHIYHFSPVSLVKSQSHITFLDTGGFRIFRSVNCHGGDDLDLVVSQAAALLRTSKKKTEIIGRLKRYRYFAFMSDWTKRVSDVRLRGQ